jgi:quinol monooxygenase YgiN
MHALLRTTVGALALALGAAPFATAQDEGPAFAVTYIEVGPSEIADTVALLRERAAASRAAHGNLRYDVLQRSGRPNHFAIIDAWASQADRDADIAARYTRNFRNALEPLLYSPYDERPSTPIMGTAESGGPGQSYAVTHVDLIPTAFDEGMVYIEAFVRSSRMQPGAVDIGIMAQNNRRNHMTLFETWASAEQRIANTAAPHALEFRNELLPRMGALYDERIYHPL